MKIKPPPELKVILIDLELTYAVYYAYPSKREQYLHDRNIVHDQFCPCAAWKWEGDKKSKGIKITDDKKRFKKDFRDDYIVAKKLHELMTEADVIVAHNGDNFDIKHANVLFKKHGLGPIPPQKSVDTLKVARKYFAFPGNSLDSLAKRFGNKGKIEKPNWTKMTEGDPYHINKGARYCINDVDVLAFVLKELKPYIVNYPQVKIKKATGRSDGDTCQKCGSGELQRRGCGVNARGKYQKYQCQNCGSWCSSEKII